MRSDALKEPEIEQVSGGVSNTQGDTMIPFFCFLVWKGLLIGGVIGAGGLCVLGSVHAKEAFHGSTVSAYYLPSH